jgi:hypothetical protein
MAKVTQKEAVFGAVCSVKGTSEFSGPVEMTREERSMVNQILFESFRGGTVELDAEYDDSKLKAYVSGLQSNWLRKDKRLNGGVAYVPKNPGSRAGSGDAQLKALRALMSTLTDQESQAEVQRHIDARVAEIAASKKQVAVDITKLPAELQIKYAALYTAKTA